MGKAVTDRPVLCVSYIHSGPLEWGAVAGRVEYGSLKHPRLSHLVHHRSRARTRNAVLRTVPTASPARRCDATQAGKAIKDRQSRGVMRRYAAVDPFDGLVSSVVPEAKYYGVCADQTSGA